MDNDHEVRDRVVTTVGIAVAAALVWVVFTTVWLWRHQERIVFQPPALPAADPASMTRLVFAAADGHELYGYVATPPANARAAAGPANARAADATSARTVVVAFHGNADLAAWYAPWARELAARTGAIVFVPEYRGYGGIPGRPTYETAASDAAGARRRTPGGPSASE